MTLKFVPSARETPKNWRAVIATDSLGIARSGYGWLAIFVGGFAAWSIAFPLASAVVAKGRLITNGENQLIQYPYAGVVKKIAVEDGAIVKKGDLIIVIDSAKAEAEYGKLSARKAFLEAQETRLRTELEPAALSNKTARTELKLVTAPTDINQEAVIQAEARALRFQADKSALEDQLKKSQEELSGKIVQIASQQEKLKILFDTANRARPLAESGVIAKSRYQDMQNLYLDAKGNLASLQAQKLSLNAGISEIGNRIKSLISGESEKSSGELSATLAELNGIQNALASAKNELDHTEIRSPMDGTLVGMQVHTVGGVIEPGRPIAELVPAGQPLNVEVRFPPKDIRDVKVGQKAHVTISAFNQRTQENIFAQVIYVSADASTDQRTGETYYTAKLSLDQTTPIYLKIQPGMEATAFIQGEARNFISYVMAPITESISKAFNER